MFNHSFAAEVYSDYNEHTSVYQSCFVFYSMMNIMHAQFGGFELQEERINHDDEM